MSSMSMNMKSNISQVLRQFKGIDKKLITPAIVTALNKTGDQAKTLVKKEVVKATGLKAGRVSKRITGKKAKWADPTYRLSVEGRHFTLDAYKNKPRQTKAGVSHSAWGQRQVAKGAFLINGIGGNRIAVKKVRGQKTSTGKGKVKALYGASAPREYERNSMENKVAAKVKEKFPKLFFTALDFHFRKSMNKGKGIMK